ncbi:MAG TPA: hypothetical protein VHX42_03880, partial [Candidatus Babeliales bacterium]|nr:hypothetical protein [Candidatus Babeliales bacterium]
AYRGTQDNVMTHVKLLSREDKDLLFGDRSRLIHDHDIQVICLSLYNLSNVDYRFFPADIDLAMMSSRDVEKLMKTNSVGRLTVSAATGISSWALGTTAMFVIGDMGIASVLGAAAFLAPSIICGATALVFFGKSIKSMIMNKRMKKDLAEKIVHKKVIIKAGDHYEGLIFVKTADYNPQFNVQLREKNNRKHVISFDVDVRENGS